MFRIGCLDYLWRNACHLDRPGVCSVPGPSPPSPDGLGFDDDVPLELIQKDIQERKQRKQTKKKKEIWWGEVESILHGFLGMGAVQFLLRRFPALDCVDHCCKRRVDLCAPSSVGDPGGVNDAAYMCTWYHYI